MSKLNSASFKSCASISILYFTHFLSPALLVMSQFLIYGQIDIKNQFRSFETLLVGVPIFLIILIEVWKVTLRKFILKLIKYKITQPYIRGIYWEEGGRGMKKLPKIEWYVWMQRNVRKDLLHPFNSPNPVKQVKHQKCYISAYKTRVYV